MREESGLVRAGGAGGGGGFSGVGARGGWGERYGGDMIGVLEGEGKGGGMMMLYVKFVHVCPDRK